MPNELDDANRASCEIVDDDDDKGLSRVVSGATFDIDDPATREWLDLKLDTGAIPPISHPAGVPMKR